jgi:hypothetical protein
VYFSQTVITSSGDTPGLATGWIHINKYHIVYEQMLFFLKFNLYEGLRHVDCVRLVCDAL